MCLLQVEDKRHFLDLTTKEPQAAGNLSAAPKAGSMINAQVTSVSGAALWLFLDNFGTL